MQGAILFFLLLFAVFFAYKAFPTTALHIYTKETPAPETASQEAPSEETFANPIPCPQASEPPGSIPTATYGGMPDTIPRPSMDPTLEPTTRARIMQTLDDLRGFLNFEGDQLEEKSDPNIQLPLSTLKGDTQVLTNEAMVLQRNPGLRPTITGRQIAEIEANLDYLRQAWRRFAGVGAVDAKEGFVGSMEGFRNNGSISRGYVVTEGFRDNVAYPKASFKLAEGFAAGDAEVFYMRTSDTTNLRFSLKDITSAIEVAPISGRVAGPNDLLNQPGNDPTDKNGSKPSLTGWTTSTTTNVQQLNTITNTFVDTGTSLASSGVSNTLLGVYVYGKKPSTDRITLTVGTISIPFVVYNYNSQYYSYWDSITPPVQNQGSSSSSFAPPAAGTPPPDAGVPPPPPVGSSSSSYVARASTPGTFGSSSSFFTGSYTVTTADRRATYDEIVDFKTKLLGEITRLVNTGATDDITKGRINNLRLIYAYITDTINKIDTKQVKLENVEIMKSSIDKALLALSDISKALPDFAKNSTLPSWLNNLLTGGSADDPETKKQIMDAIANYANNFSNNFSWSVDLGLDYTSPAKEKAMAAYYNKRGAEGRGNSSAVNSGLNLNIAGDGVGVMPDGSAAGTVTDEYGRQPGERCAGDAARFDWKKRSREICSAIKARGLEPAEFGCMPDGVTVSPDFSYKGYARMVCHRVSANYDPGFGYLVGCPPADWQGWR